VEEPWPFGALHGLTKSDVRFRLMQWVLMVSILVLVSGYLAWQFLSGTLDDEAGEHAVDPGTPEAAPDRELKAA
jgi:hypothetical protein